MASLIMISGYTAPLKLARSKISQTRKRVDVVALVMKAIQKSDQILLELVCNPVELARCLSGVCVQAELRAALPTLVNSG